jgi:hypothetical protein
MLEFYSLSSILSDGFRRLLRFFVRSPATGPPRERSFALFKTKSMRTRSGRHVTDSRMRLQGARAPPHPHLVNCCPCVLGNWPKVHSRQRRVVRSRFRRVKNNSHVSSEGAGRKHLRRHICECVDKR